jgi:hypothetical protein
MPRLLPWLQGSIVSLLVGIIADVALSIALLRLLPHLGSRKVYRVAIVGSRASEVRARLKPIIMASDVS